MSGIRQIEYKGAIFAGELEVQRILYLIVEPLLVNIKVLFDGRRFR